MAPPRIGYRPGALLLLLLIAGCGEDAASPPAPRVPAAAPEERAPETASAERSAPEARPPASANAGAAGDELAPMPATVLRDTELKQEPFVDAQNIATLAAGSAVTVLERRGGWFRVESGERRGWVRLLQVSTQPGGDGIGAEELESAVEIATGRRGGGNIASTTGVRGLTPEQLRQAEPDMDALQQLETYGADAEAAQAYARAHGLERREVPFLPEPE